MSTKYTGGFITKSPVAPTTTAASGIWTLDQQQQAQKAGTWPSPPIFIEDLFSTYLYTGTNPPTATQTINNGIDLAGKGGLVWCKPRNDAEAHILTDTARGANNILQSQATDPSYAVSNYLNSFNSNGFTVGNNLNAGIWNLASWTFRKQPKFFDVVTYTGNGSAGGQTINHSLGSAPGCIIVKQTNSTQPWRVYHQSLGVPAYLALNSTAASATDANNPWKTPTSTTFGVGDGTYWTSLNASGSTYVAYLFAHNAGGFPASGAGSTNGISCGSFTSSAGGLATVNLGYEPQWILYKGSNGITNWQLVDNMRGFVVGAAATGTSFLNANTSAAEGTNPPVGITNTGFNFDGAPNITFIYIAVRRGPMKTPTTGTSVFYPNTITGNATATTITSTGFAPDLFFSKARSFASLYLNVMVDRLRGASQFLVPTNIIAETLGTNVVLSLNMNGVTIGTSSNTNASGVTYVQWNFRRAPGFFDEVCYTGAGGQALTHNLGVTPELIIVKTRSDTYNWLVYSATTGTTNILFLDLSDAVTAYTGFTSVTSNTFSPAGVADTSGETYVAYLFATCPGVSKVGSYTGTGAAQTINCGFTAGSRFVMIKRTDSIGGWYVWDSARGIIPANDPYLLINSTAVEVTGTDYVDTTNVGFDITSTAPAEINASGGTYIFLAIA